MTLLDPSEVVVSGGAVFPPVARIPPDALVGMVAEAAPLVHYGAPLLHMVGSQDAPGVRGDAPVQGVFAAAGHGVTTMLLFDTVARDTFTANSANC